MTSEDIHLKEQEWEGKIILNRYLGLRFLWWMVDGILTSMLHDGELSYNLHGCSGSVARLLATFFQVFFLPNLKNNGVPFQAWHIFEDEVDDFQVLLPLQKTGSVLLEVVKEVVQDKVGPCNKRNTHFGSLSHTHTRARARTHPRTNISITSKFFLVVMPIRLIVHIRHTLIRKKKRLMWGVRIRPPVT